MTLAEKIRFSFLIYFSYSRHYRLNRKATLDLNKYYWLDGNSYNIIHSKWRVENGIPLGLYTHGLDAPLVQRVNITGMCEYGFALAELDREEELHLIAEFIDKNICRASDGSLQYAHWPMAFFHEENSYFIDGMGQGQ